jgi:hypothetical protein
MDSVCVRSAAVILARREQDVCPHYTDGLGLEIADLIKPQEPSCRRGDHEILVAVVGFRFRIGVEVIVDLVRSAARMELSHVAYLMTVRTLGPVDFPGSPQPVTFPCGD